MAYEPIITHGGLPETNNIQKTRDGLLETRVAGTLATAKSIISPDISVEAHGSTIHLGGSVPQTSHVNKAREIAQSVDGVEHVISQIIVKVTHH